MEKYLFNLSPLSLLLAFAAAILGHHLRREKKDGTYSKGHYTTARHVFIFGSPNELRVYLGFTRCTP